MTSSDPASPAAASTPWTLANLDFEYELAAARTSPPPALLARWRDILRLLPGHANARALAADAAASLDALATAERPGALSVWGVTPRARTAARALGLEPHWPDDEAVRAVNDKRFSHAIEGRLGRRLPWSSVVATGEELSRAAERCPVDWVAKHPFGVSGRERILGKAGVLDASGRRWAERQFSDGWSLVFEPWIAIERELSIQFDIAKDGTVAFVGACVLLADRVGTFRGHLVRPDFALPPGLRTEALAAAREVAARGYFGPVGFDALEGSLAGERMQRAVTEINARYTFGRLALELARFVPPGWSFVWWHPSRERLGALRAHLLASGQAPAPISPAAERAELYRLPAIADPGGATGTFVIAAPHEELLVELARRDFGLEVPAGGVRA